MKQINPTAIPRTPWNFFLYVSKPHRAWLWFGVCVIVVTSALSTSTSYFFKLIVDAVEVGDTAAALRYALLYPAAILVIQLMYRLSGLSGMHATTKVSKESADTLLAYLLRHNNAYFTNRFAGSITNKIRNVTGAFESIIPDFLWNQLDALVAFVVTFVLIASVNMSAALVFFALLCTLALVNQRLAPEKTRLSKINAEAGTKLQGGMSDVVGNMSAVRQYAQAQTELSKLKALTETKRVTSQANWLFTEKLLLSNVLVIFVFAALMFWSLTTAWSTGQISTGDFVLVLALVSQITAVMVFIGRAVNATARTIGELREGLDDILVPYEIEDASTATELHVLHGKIEWQKVGFKYDSNTIFSNFSLTIEPKQRIGLVGHSGAGKSTFVSLLLRQSDLNEGAIMIDGQDITAVSQDSLRRAIAVVPQEPVLFHRTIAENIAYSNPEATMSEIEAVAKLAYAHEFIVGLPLGYNTLVGERGVKLSGGQKQRIAIARAMLKNAPILILDEATSALDSESESLIQAALHTLMSGKTVIAIAHRLSTLKEMDRIVVLENGVVVEDGVHSALTQAGGIYARLWDHQSGGFIAD